MKCQVDEISCTDWRYRDSVLLLWGGLQVKIPIFKLALKNLPGEEHSSLFGCSVRVNDKNLVTLTPPVHSVGRRHCYGLPLGHSGSAWPHGGQASSVAAQRSGSVRLGRLCFGHSSSSHWLSESDVFGPGAASSGNSERRRRRQYFLQHHQVKLERTLRFTGGNIIKLAVELCKL